MLEALALVGLAAVLAAAVLRPRGLPEAAAAVPVALLLLAVGAVSWPHARAELTRLGPVVGFLAAVLALADACDGEGLFAAAGQRLARRTGGSPVRLLVGVFALASVTTAVLSLDTTVVLITPVVLVTARRAGAVARPPLYACAHLANSASLPLPVSNLTNLLAVAVVPLSFLRFSALMALPWLVVVAVELAVFAVFFRADLQRTVDPEPVEPAPLPVFALVVVVATLVGFVLTSLAGLAPVWAATAGALVLAGKRVARRETTVWRVVLAASPSFCAFVLALAVVVRAGSDHGLARVARDVLPHGASLPALLGVAAVAAVASNVVNNLPATLLLLPIVAPAGVAPVLAVLVGVNVGPNLTYAGSLATLLWRRRLLAGAEGVPRWGEFTRLGLATVPLGLLAGTTAVWVVVRVIGTS